MRISDVPLWASTRDDLTSPTLKDLSVTEVKYPRHVRALPYFFIRHFIKPKDVIQWSFSVVSDEATAKIIPAEVTGYCVTDVVIRFVNSKTGAQQTKNIAFQHLDKLEFVELTQQSLEDRLAAYLEFLKTLRSAHGNVRYFSSQLPSL